MSLREGSRICLMDYYRGDNQHWKISYRLYKFIFSFYSLVTINNLLCFKLLFKLFRYPIYCYIEHQTENSFLSVIMNSDKKGGSVVLSSNRREGDASQMWWEDEQGIIHSALNNMVLDTSE